MTGLVIELILLAILIVVLAIYLIKNKEKIFPQPIIRFGKFNLLEIVLVRTGWGLGHMDSWAKKYREWIKLFGITAIGIGFLGILANFFLLIFMVWSLIKSPGTQQVSLVLPFTDVPGLGYLSFTHWIIALFVLATVHEFAHGVVARAYNVPVKHSGFAVLSFFKIPLVPAAFVEPDEKEFPKTDSITQYSVLAAGPISNILLAIPFLLLILFVTNPMTTALTEPAGFSFATITENGSAAQAGIVAGQTYTYVNGKFTNDSTLFYRELWFGTAPGEQFTIGYINQTSGDLVVHTIMTQAAPEDPSRALIGVAGIVDERVFTKEAAPYQSIFNWFKDLLKYLYLFNLLVGLFNLMPLHITDGGQIIRVMALQTTKTKEQAMKRQRLICNICLAVLIAAFIIPFIFG
ncbi:MAG TPA: site-2 protease family protein [Acidobacteriota bacterium]|nr:site-2 protease family protein [Acidobacteriota bacterium]